MNLYDFVVKVSVTAAVRTVNEDLLAIERWALATGLPLNASKTQVLFCGAPHKFIIAKHSLTERFFFLMGLMTFSEVVKNFGVLFDESLESSDLANFNQIYGVISLMLG
jgi:hypothetical protein